MKLRYYISIKSRDSSYSTVIKEFTEAEFYAYWDGVTTKGGKVIGYTTETI